MGTDRPYEQARNFTFEKDDNDHRQPWIQKPTKLAKMSPDAFKTLRGYLAQHGDWREITVTGHQSIHSWEFTICQCPLCQKAAELVGHPETPHG